MLFSQASTEDVHGKNSIEAAADKTVDALKAVKRNLETGEPTNLDARWSHR